jgi:hypothetical protein
MHTELLFNPIVVFKRLVSSRMGVFVVRNMSCISSLSYSMHGF